MPQERKISPARKPLNTVYEDALAAFSAAIAPLYNEVRELKAMVTNKPQLLTYTEIRQGYNLSRHQVKKFVQLGKLKKVGTGRPRFSRSDLDNLIQGYEIKMSKV